MNIACIRCLLTKDSREFHKDKSKPTGYKPYCKQCRHEVELPGVLRYNKSEAGRARTQRFNNSDYAKMRRRIVYRANIQENRLKACQWYAKNTERAKANVQLWRSRNPDKRRRQEHNRRVRKYSQTTNHYTPKQWETLCALYGYRCLCCGENKPLTVDHIVPLSKGGSNGHENIQCLCSECNSRKGVKVIDYRLLPRAVTRG